MISSQGYPPANRYFYDGLDWAMTAQPITMHRHSLRNAMLSDFSCIVECLVHESEGASENSEITEASHSSSRGDAGAGNDS